MTIDLRRVRDEDCVLFFRLWSDPEVQRFVRIPKFRLSFDDHAAWFVSRLAESPEWFVGEVGERPVGIVRVDDGPGSCWWVSIIIDARFRGQGHGVALLVALADAVSYRPLYARIHACNIPSLRTFAKAGYELSRKEPPWHIYVRR